MDNSPSLTPTHAHSCPHRDPTKIMPRHNVKSPTHKLKTPRQLETKIFCENIQKQKHLTPPTPASHKMHTQQALTNPNYQPYLKFHLIIKATFKIRHVPPKINMTPTDNHTAGRNSNPPSANGPCPPNTARPMHCTNGRKHHRRKYINGTIAERHHKTNCQYPNGNSIKTKLHIILLVRYFLERTVR